MSRCYETMIARFDPSKDDDNSKRLDNLGQQRWRIVAVVPQIGDLNVGWGKPKSGTLAHIVYLERETGGI